MYFVVLEGFSGNGKTTLARARVVLAILKKGNVFKQ
jgi:ABC-type oligopeptide transport system ATPase subunit